MASTIKLKKYQRKIREVQKQNKREIRPDDSIKETQLTLFPVVS